MPKITFIEEDGNKKIVDAPLGLSVMEISQKHDLDIEASCGGCLSCATCHVIVDPKDFDKLEEIEEGEEDMLDMAFGLTKTSRLSCQLIMTEELDGLVIALPGAPIDW